MGLDDAAGTRGAITEVGRNSETTTAADFHSLHSLVPSSDDLTSAEAKDERVTPVPRRIKFFAGRPCDADVVHADTVARSCFVSIANDEVIDQEVCRSVAFGRINKRSFKCHVVRLGHGDRKGESTDERT